jgi:hypothetical protein
VFGFLSIFFYHLTNQIPRLHEVTEESDDEDDDNDGRDDDDDDN